LAEEAMVELGSGARAIVPGRVGDSELWRRVTHEDDEQRMPPATTGDPLDAQQLATPRRWIESGATYARHWSFEPPRRVRPPAPTAHAQWAADPLDRWVLTAMQAHDLAPNPAADRATLLRRVTLDLTGLPPSPEEVDAFLADSSPTAYERAVDRLLASPAYGERWARVWLDLARFADSAGYAQDPPRTIWRYRDWVINAWNAGMPLDQFTIEQLAGDLLPNPTHDQLLATAFHRNTMTNSEGGTDDEEFRTAAVVDRVNTTMQVWMGLTMGCAQCHSHKYDPISQDEYFRFYAVFNNTADADRGDESPLLTEFTPEQRQQIDELDARLAMLTEQSRGLSQLAAGTEPGETPAPEATEKLAALKQQIETLQAERAKIKGVETPILRELPAGERRTTYVQIRGNFLNRGAQVEPGLPAAFPAWTGSDPIDRLAVARWLVGSANPLTARVAVNRLWEQLFGAGLVVTSEDFGTQGEAPTHPELLDTLALDYVRLGWDTKEMLRRIVTSSTYRQSSAATDVHRDRDPLNRWLARGPSHRLPAEMVRDQSLAIAGLLSRKLHGPSVRPPRPALGLNSAFGGSTDWDPSPGEDRFRRGLYTEWRRTTPYPSFTTFDAPSREVCTIRRIATNTPLQAFVTLNDPAFVEAAQALAQRMWRSAPASAEQQIVSGFRWCLARQPTSQERERLVQLYQEARQHYARDPAAARTLAPRPKGSDDEAGDMVDLAAATVVANVLLNLDETLTKN
jgi:hypothetical protein